MKWKNLELNTTLFLITNALFFLCGIHTFSKISLKATVFSFGLGGTLSYFLLSIYLHQKKGKTLKLKDISKVKASLIIILSILILNYSITRITGFITYNVVSTLSYYLLVSAFLLVSIFVVYKGFKGIVRSSFLYFLIILLLIIINFIFLFPKMDFQNVLPLLDTNFKNILKSTGLYTIISLGAYIYLPYFNVHLTKTRIQYLKRGFILTQIFLISYTLVVFSILGIHITNLYPYPEVSILKKVSFLNIIDRMESIFSLSYFLSLFTHFTITLYGIIELLEKFFPKEKRTLTLFIVAFLLFLLNSFYESSLTIWFLSYILLLIISCITGKSIRKQGTL